MALKTDYKDFILNTGEDREFSVSQNPNMTTKITDVTTYAQDGDFISASVINATNLAIVTDYTTTEQKLEQKFMGKPIYAKVLTLGALPNAGVKRVAHGVANLKDLVLFSGHAKSATGFLPLLYTSTTYYINGGDVVIQTASDRSSYTECNALMMYTKTTD
jgi:hypothetical protein